MATHLAAIALFGGMVLATDLRLLGVAMRRRPVADVVGQLRPLKHLGLTIVVICGALMLGSKAEEYYYNAFFRMKMAVLALIVMHALVFRSQCLFAIISGGVRSDGADSRARETGGMFVAGAVDFDGGGGAGDRVYRAAAE